MWGKSPKRGSQVRGDIFCKNKIKKIFFSLFTDVIVRDSIIKNKERTKSYWEQLMMAAASENQNMVKVRTWDINETSNSNPNSNR